MNREEFYRNEIVRVSNIIANMALKGVSEAELGDHVEILKELVDVFRNLKYVDHIEKKWVDINKKKED